MYLHSFDSTANDIVDSNANTLYTLAYFCFQQPDNLLNYLLQYQFVFHNIVTYPQKEWQQAG